MEGKVVKWYTVNGVATGVIVKPANHGEGNWVVSLKSGKSVIVNERSFING